MIVRSTFEELASALEHSRDQLVWKAPTFKIVELGLYSISGSSGGLYKVKCGRTRNNKFFVECLCRANQHGKPCYHALKAFELHVDLMIEIKFNKKETTNYERN